MYQSMSAFPQSNAATEAGARKTPKGTSGVSNPSPRARARAQPMGMTNSTNVTAPMAAASRTASSARPGPSAAPAIAISVESPNPIASFLRATSPRQPTIVMPPAPTQAPRRASSRPLKGNWSPVNTPATLVIPTNRRPVTVNPSGITYDRRSVMAMPRRMVTNTASRTARSPGPATANAATQIAPVTASTTGYIGEIGRRQVRHRARRMSHDTTGMLSYQASALPQPGQRERGRTTDSSAGQRRMQTLRNEPMLAPTKKTKMPRSGLM